jgi:hypothetical protein
MRLSARRWQWALLPTLWIATGCGAGWSQVPVAPTALESEPMEVRVTRDDGSRVVFSVPRIERDSLFGEVDGRPRVMALSEVRRLALPVASKSRKAAGTVAVIAALAVFAAGWTYIIVTE